MAIDVSAWGGIYTAVIIIEENSREWCTMCPSPESDQKTASFPPFTKSFFWVAGWDPFRCPCVKGRTQDPLRESHILGRTDGELTLLLYSVVLPDCM